MIIIEHMCVCVFWHEFLQRWRTSQPDFKRKKTNSFASNRVSVCRLDGIFVAQAKNNHLKSINKYLHTHTQREIERKGDRV